MKIVLDRARCKQHGQCRGAAPELFDFAADGSLIVLNENPPEELREAAQDAVDVCPEQAISIQD
jgi:ferredoxin